MSSYSSRAILSVCIATLCIAGTSSAENQQDTIPLPEHPRPDFQRSTWKNLNGTWQFQFDADDVGREGQWFDGNAAFNQEINVPFPWGSELSGVEDQADIGWYARSVTVPESWKGQRVYLVVGASDWHTTAWLDGQRLGEHQGGYTPFAFDLTPHLRFGQPQRLVVRVDDTPHSFKLEGKQGYGRAAGIWQTVYLERRPEVALETIQFTPDIDEQRVDVHVTLNGPAPQELPLELMFRPHDRATPRVKTEIPSGAKGIRFHVELPDARLWSLEDPYLYEVTATLDSKAGVDKVATYFGMRKISVGKLPGTDYPYVLLNNQPVYLQMSLDQAYHPQGYYTFPSDEFMRDEILRARQIGLNGQRIHIKVEIPRKLYWADRLGMLIMADVPNSWGEPDASMRSEIEYALRGMIKRDYNHPSIFSWVNFNETWGLKSGKEKKYLPETQEWVAEMYRLTKKLDPSRLVEDNSPCNEDHVITDLNTWHAYLPGYAWRERLDQICRETYPGSTWNYIGGRKQRGEPMFNSECGNVWGYEGSAGDVDWSWDYHIMINEFRRHPEVCGWLYTEHHDVINEWNGYWRYDRSQKFTGMGQLADGMSLRDLHAPFYIASERELCRQVKPAEQVNVPLYASFLTDADVPGPLTLDLELYGWDALGRRHEYWIDSIEVPYQPWMSVELPPATIPMPAERALAVLALSLRDASGSVLHRNFTTYDVSDGISPRDERLSLNGRPARVIRFAAPSFRDAQWSLKQWNVLNGLKVNGAGAGYFEYAVALPKDLDPGQVTGATLCMELSAKQLFGKDREGARQQEGDFMRGKGTHDPSSNPNAYPMTDETKFPSRVRVRVMGHPAGIYELADDSADHRGILSWHSQKRDRRLREAGSYGDLVRVPIDRKLIEQACEAGKLVIRLEVDEALPGGVAIYGERFGRYPLDPTLVLLLNQ